MNFSMEGFWRRAASHSGVWAPVRSWRGPGVTTAQPGTRRCPRRSWGQKQSKPLLVAQGCFPTSFQPQQPPSACSQEHCPSTTGPACQGDAASISFIPHVPLWDASQLLLCWAITLYVDNGPRCSTPLQQELFKCFPPRIPLPLRTPALQAATLLQWNPVSRATPAGSASPWLSLREQTLLSDTLKTSRWSLISSLNLCSLQ